MRVALLCCLKCLARRVEDLATIDVTTSGATDQNCQACGEPMRLEAIEAFPRVPRKSGGSISAAAAVEGPETPHSERGRAAQPPLLNKSGGSDVTRECCMLSSSGRSLLTVGEAWVCECGQRWEVTRPALAEKR